MRLKKTLTIELDEWVWWMFMRYARLLDRKLAAQDQPRVHYGRLVGTLITDFLLRHEDRILQEVTELDTRGVTSRLGLRSLAHFGTAKIPEVLRTRRGEPEKPGRKRGRKPRVVPAAIGGAPGGTAAGCDDPSGEVRSGDAKLATEAADEGEEVRHAKLG